MKNLLLLPFAALMICSSILKAEIDPLTTAIQELNVNEVDTLLKSGSYYLTPSYQAQLLSLAQAITQDKELILEEKPLTLKYSLGTVSTGIGLYLLKVALSKDNFDNLRTEAEENFGTRTSENLELDIKSANETTSIAGILGTTATIFGIKQLYSAITRSEEQTAYEKALAITQLIKKAPLNLTLPANL